jgi:hypothetical protein
VQKFFRALGTSSLLWFASGSGISLPVTAHAEPVATAEVPAATDSPAPAPSTASQPSTNSQLPLEASLDDEFIADAMLDGKFVVLSTNGYGTSGDDYWENCDDEIGPLWTIRVGAVILDRSKPENDVIARPAGGLLTVSAGGDFDFDWSSGVDVYVARQPFNGFGVDFRYFNLDSDASFNYGDTGDLDIGHSSALNLFDVDSRYGSKLHSSEVNLRMPTSSRTTWLAGFRWLELSEQLNYDIDLLSLVDNDFRWNTDNHMYGGQGGVDLQLWDLESPLSINSVLKAGVYGNNADNHFQYHVNNFPILNGGQSNGEVAFVGDIGINLSYQVTRHFALTGGYQLLWISGAALASDQAALTLNEIDIDVLTTSGDLFYHGALTGATVTW